MGLLLEKGWWERRKEQESPELGCWSLCCMQQPQRVGSKRGSLSSCPQVAGTGDSQPSHPGTGASSGRRQFLPGHPLH